MKKLVPKLLKKTLPLGLGISLIWMSLSKLTEQDIQSAKNAFQTANYGWILLSLALGLLSHFSRAYRWKFMLEPMGYAPKFGNSCMAVLIGYLVNLGIPRAGEVSRAASLTKYEGIPFEKTFGTIVAERVADVLMLMLFVGWAFLAQFDLIKNALLSKVPQNPWLIVGSFGLVVIGFYVLTKGLKKANKNFFKKLNAFVAGMISGIKSILHMEKKGAFVFHTVLIWALYLGMLYVATFALPETSGVSIHAVLIAFILGSVSYAATNGGVGSYPLAVQQALLIYGISKIPGLSFGWIVWTSQTLMILIFGGLSFVFLPLYNQKTSSAKKK